MHQCRECGKWFSEMRVHLRHKHKMTLQEYNMKWETHAPTFNFVSPRLPDADAIANQYEIDRRERERRRAQ